MSVKFGCCLMLGSFVPQSAGSSTPGAADQVRAGLSALSRAGYDFAEMTVQSLTRLSEEQFAEVRQAIGESALRVPAFNSFIPGSLKLTGPDASESEQDEYLDLALQRVKAVGGELIVFGSGAARSVPAGFPVERGLEQIRRFLERCGQYAAKYGVTIVIEPLNGKESNVINTVREAMALAEELGHPQIKVLADSYHMDLEKEPFAVVEEAASKGLLSHVHISGRDRRFPGTADEREEIDFAQLFRALQRSGYSGGISAECKSEHYEEDSAKSIAYVRAKWRDAAGR